MTAIVFYFQGLYQRRRIRSRFDESMRVAVAVMLATVLLTAGLTFYRPPDFTYSRLFLAIFAGVDAILVGLTRWLVGVSLARIRRSGGNLQRVLVVGAGELGRKVVERLNLHKEYGFSIVGFLDDDPGRQQRSIQGVPVLGTTRELEQVIEEENVDQVMIALPLEAHYRTVQLVRRAGLLVRRYRFRPVCAVRGSKITRRNRRDSKTPSRSCDRATAPARQLLADQRLHPSGRTEALCAIRFAVRIPRGY